MALKLDLRRQKVAQYVNKLEIATNAVSNEANLDNLLNAIYDSSVKAVRSCSSFREEWFDGSCLKARQKSFKWLNLYRKHNTVFEKDMYLQANKNFKDLCKSKKRAYYENMSNKLNSVKDNNDFWDLVRKLRGKRAAKSNRITSDNFKNYFECLLNPLAAENAFLYAAPYADNALLDGDIRLDELLSVLQKAKDNKAPGPDRIPYEFFKRAPLVFLNKLASVFNDVYQNANVPEKFSNSIIFPIYKKGDPNIPENYRGLSFMDAVAKLLTGIINSRLAIWEQTNKVLNESQAGFRSGYSTIDNIFNLVNIIKIKIAKRKGKVYAFFVDFRAAFDTINRSALFYKLYQLGVSTKCIRFLQSLYKTTTAQVWNGIELSQKFYTNSGLRQGCLLSPLLFSLFINDIEDYFSGGINIDGLKIKSLLYADDLVLLAEDPVELQSMIDKLEEYCRTWDMVVNLDKSKVMIFKNGGGRLLANEKWKYLGNSIEIVKRYKYLGVTLTPQVSMKAHLTERLRAAKGVLNSTWSKTIRNPNIDHSSKYRIYTATSRSVLCYGAQVWGFSEYEEVEKLQRFFIKKLLCLPQKTPNYVLTLETGLPKLLIFTLRCHFEYMIKVLNNYSENRLPHILAKKVIEKGLFWYDEWDDLAQKHNIKLDRLEASGQNLPSVLTAILEREERWHWTRAMERARLTVRHGLYDKLNYDLGESNYFRNESSISNIRRILLCRSGMLQLNASPWRLEGSSMCSLCNLEEDEDLVHYLGRCPILKEFRLTCFAKAILTEDECISILNGNGSNFDGLVQYAKEAWRYRTMLVQEFNC